jgi:hypothetical protein
MQSSSATFVAVTLSATVRAVAASCSVDIAAAAAAAAGDDIDNDPVDGCIPSSYIAVVVVAIVGR